MEPTRPPGRVRTPEPQDRFRMLLLGYFEGLDSQRAIAWRTADSASLPKFLDCRRWTRPR